VQDARVALRALRREPAFAVAVALTIALGVGVNAAVFSLMDAVLLRTLPVPDAASLVFLHTVGDAGRAPPYPAFERLRAASPTFAAAAAFATDELRIEVDGVAEQVMGQVASARYFDVLGVRPALGRLTVAGDERLDAPVAVISDRYWRRRFGGDSAAIGRTITHQGRSYTVVGVTPPEFWGLVPGTPVDVTLPLTVARDMMRDPDARWFDAVVRLPHGISASRAAAEATVTLRSLLGEPASSDEARRPRVELVPAAHGMDALRRRFSGPLYALTGIATLVLLIAVVNVTSLLLARGSARGREYAIRLAAGAGRARLVRQTLTETVLLYALGAVPAMLLARWGVGAIGVAFAQGRRAITVGTRVDWRVLAFALATTLVAGLVSGLLPAWTASRTEPHDAMQDAPSRATESRAVGAFGRTLVVAQVALSVVLLVGAAAFVQTLANLRRVDLGFRPDRVLTMSVEPPEGSVRQAEGAAFWARVLADVRALPGVRAAALSSIVPLSGRDPREVVRFAGGSTTAVDSTARVGRVSAGYVETLGLSLLRGRTLTERDAAGAERVALVNESAARAHFADSDPIGRTVRVGGGDYRVVGLLRDAKHLSLREPTPPFVFLPVGQVDDVPSRLTLLVASSMSDARSLRAVRRALDGVRAGILVSEVVTVRGQVDDALLAERLLSALSGVFGALALLLASIGLHGVLSYRIGRQRRAIGIRLALGAAPLAVAREVLRQGAIVIGAGLLVGLPVAVLVARAADAMLWGIGPRDVTLYGVAVALLALGGLAGAYAPARRAAGLDPVDVLRHD